MGSTQVLKGNLGGLLLSMHRQQATQAMRRQGISSATGHATKRHLYRSKGLDLLSPSMQVLIGVVGRSANGNKEPEAVAIVDQFKASTKGKVTIISQDTARRNTVLSLHECLAKCTRRKQY